MKSLSFMIFAFSSSLALIGCSSHHKEPIDKPTLKVSEAKMKSLIMPHLSGTVKFEQKEGGLYMVAHVSGLKPNATMGFHIHNKGKCEGPDYKTAGDHLNPYQHHHNGPSETDKHLGDLGNLTADNRGHAMKELLISTDAKDLDMIIGKAVIIHAKADDFKTQPSGNSGDRIACGLIELSK